MAHEDEKFQTYKSIDKMTLLRFPLKKKLKKNK